MNSQKEVAQKDLSVEELNDLIIDCIQDIKGKKIVKLDLRHLEEAPTDFFIICEGDSITQTKAICDNIYRRLKEETGLFPSHYEGQKHAKWLLLDYFETVVHVFHKETRVFYELEDLWGDALFTEYEDL